MHMLQTNSIPRTFPALRKLLVKNLMSWTSMGKTGRHRAETFRIDVTNYHQTLSFAYGTQYYKEIRGGAMGSSLTMVLDNIYMLE